MSVMEMQAAAHDSGPGWRGRSGGDLPQQFKLTSSPHQTCGTDREPRGEKGRKEPLVSALVAGKQGWAANCLPWP